MLLGRDDGPRPPGVPRAAVPVGTNQINWTRDNTSAALTAATSTVMVVEWGSEWTVQRVRVTGTNGGNGLNAAGEYNTAALTTPVARANTWVWGTGHADGNGIGNQAEGVAITLGNGVSKNTTESLVAVGTEIGGTAVDFEVWTLTHPLLAVDYRFKADGDAGNLTVDVPVDAAGADRMALVYNGQDGNSDNYPRPIFSARYLNDSLVRLERRRSGSAFPALAAGHRLLHRRRGHNRRRRRPGRAGGVLGQRHPGAAEPP